MGSLGRLGCNMNPEQKSLLQNHNFSFRPLGTAGHQSPWRIFGLSWQPIVAFIFTTLILVPTDFRFSNEQLDTAIYSVVVALLLAYPVLALGVLALGIARTAVYSRVRWSAVVFWVWWPFFSLALCCAAIALGTSLGNFLWRQHFLPHEQLGRLQAYRHVDPAHASGARLQDAGLVVFNETAVVDRSRTGCLKNGATYCVAPVLAGPGAAHLGLFMAGVDCCSCPGEFRCGDWNQPATLGGMRIVDVHDRSFFKLAAEDWSSLYGGPAEQPVFFQWVAEPLAVYHELHRRGYRLLVLGLVVGPCVLLILAAALNGLLALLVDARLVSPVDAPVLSGSLGRKLGQNLLPDLYGGERAQADPKYVCL